MNRLELVVHERDLQQFGKVVRIVVDKRLQVRHQLVDCRVGWGNEDSVI